MAWYTLKMWYGSFRKNRLKFDAVQMYKKYRYDCWYAGLTDEQRDAYEKWKIRKKKEEDESFARVCMSIGMMYASACSKYLPHI